MTAAKIWTIIRWPIAIIALLAVANYAYPRFLDSLGTMIEFDASGSILAPETETETAAPLPTIQETTQATLQAPTGPVTDGALAPVADFFVHETAADVENEQLVITDDPADTIVIAFDVPEGDPSCMEAMTLNVVVDEVLSTTEVGVFPADLTQGTQIEGNQADQIVAFQQVDGDVRASTTPMTTALVEQEGLLVLDVLAGYQRYFDLGLPADSQLVFAITPTIPVETQGGVSFVSANAGTEDVPSLTWTAAAECPTAGLPAPTPTS